MAYIPTRRQPGYLSLAYAIIEHAQADVKRLQQIGVLVNGKPVRPWPDKGAKNRRYGYRHACEVDELISFFTNYGLETLLDFVGSKLNPEAIRDKLKLNDYSLSHTPTHASEQRTHHALSGM